MNPQRLTDIWNKLQKGDRVLGWAFEKRESKDILISSQGSRSWVRTSDEGVWEEAEGTQIAATRP